MERRVLAKRTYHGRGVNRGAAPVPVSVGSGDPLAGPGQRPTSRRHPGQWAHRSAIAPVECTIVTRRGHRRQRESGPAPRKQRASLAAVVESAPETPPTPTLRKNPRGQGCIVPAWVVVKWTQGRTVACAEAISSAAQNPRFLRFPAHERTAAAFHRLPSRQPAGQVGKRAVARADPPTEDLSGLDRSAEMEPRLRLGSRRSGGKNTPRTHPPESPVHLAGSPCTTSSSIHRQPTWQTVANLPFLPERGPSSPFVPRKKRGSLFRERKNCRLGQARPRRATAHHHANPQSIPNRVCNSSNRRAN